MIKINENAGNVIITHQWVNINKHQSSSFKTEESNKYFLKFYISKDCVYFSTYNEAQTALTVLSQI